MTLTLNKLTGWGLSEIQSLSFEEAEDYVKDAIEVAQYFAEKGLG